MVKDTYIQVRLTAEMKEQIFKKAEADGRSASSYVLQLIKKDLEKEN